ncbi:MAG: SUMF1/EgtB/PvdO family nonheme iron enzyme [Polyangiaceae bacterium]|nr:SUMF1/EgtB/PvdO family nonheme iron enzyme [Polyangiaceae bacterium]
MAEQRGAQRAEPRTNGKRRTLSRAALSLGLLSSIGSLGGCDALSGAFKLGPDDSPSGPQAAAADESAGQQELLPDGTQRTSPPKQAADPEATTDREADETAEANAETRLASAEADEPVTADVKSGKRCPPGMALIQGRFCIDRWEASLETASGEAHSPYQSVGAEKLKATTGKGNVPQGYISMNEAGAACQRSGKRLCSTAEWLDACAGSSKRPLRSYPYGNEEQADACNADQPGSPTMVLHHGRHKTDSYWMNDPRINQLGGTVAPTGSFDQCVSPEGVYDLVGNLLEWTQGDRPLLMGGYYLDSHENGDGCRYVTMRHGADYHDYSTGFRCCAAPTAAEADAAPAEPAAEKPPAPVAVEPAPPPAPVASAPEAVAAAPQAQEGPRDPAGKRSFEHPGAPLPDVGQRAGYSTAEDACPADMVLVEGERCTLPIQECKYWVDDPGMPNRSCGEFEPSVCKGAKQAMRYCIDRYEFTPPGYTYPIVNVSWGEAQLMCGKLGKRLCYEAEWEFACEGPEALPYPYGYKRDGEACNHDRPDLFTSRGKLNDQRVPGDSLNECKSPFGVYNIIGNVDEWTTRGGGGRRSVLRGGWWLKGRNRCRAATGSHGENYAGAQTGFRCCQAAR